MNDYPVGAAPVAEDVGVDPYAGLEDGVDVTPAFARDGYVAPLAPDAEGGPDEEERADSLAPAAAPEPDPEPDPEPGPEPGPKAPVAPDAVPEPAPESRPADFELDASQAEDEALSSLLGEFNRADGDYRAALAALANSKAALAEFTAGFSGTDEFGEVTRWPMYVEDQDRRDELRDGLKAAEAGLKSAHGSLQSVVERGAVARAVARAEVHGKAAAKGLGLDPEAHAESLAGMAKRGLLAPGLLTPAEVKALLAASGPAAPAPRAPSATAKHDGLGRFVSHRDIDRQAAEADVARRRRAGAALGAAGARSVAVEPGGGKDSWRAALTPRQAQLLKVMEGND